jgi:poly-beta-hydroxyalkanoate depolymerase
MIRVNIVDLKPGMVLAQSVQNHQGVLLLDAGTKITKKNIRIFKSWGVNEFTVEGELNKLKAAGETQAAEIRAAVKMALKAKFSDVMDDPVMVEIFNAASKQLTKDLPKSEHEKENSRPKKNYR